MDTVAGMYIRIIDAINRITKYIVVTLLFACVMESFIEVILRYFFKIPIGWGNEFCRFTLIWIAFLAASHAARQGGMIRLEVVFIIFKDMPEWMKKGIGNISATVSVVFYLIAIYCTWIVIYAIHGLQHSAALIIPMSFMYSAIIVGSSLLILNTIAAVLDPIHKDETSDVLEMVEDMRNDNNISILIDQIE